MTNFKVVENVVKHCLECLIYLISIKTKTKAVFTLNVNYIQLNYDSIYHTPFDFIQVWFYSHLRKFK